MSVAIPIDRADAVADALQAVFGVGQADELIPLTAGLSGALVYRARVRDALCLLRVETAERSAFADPHRQYLCMRRAAQVEVAPAVLYADPDAGVAICEHIAAQPLASFPGGMPAAALEVATLVRRLQRTPVFPALTDYFDGVDGLIGALMASGVVSQAAMAPTLSAYGEIKAAYPRLAPEQWVSSHNDINPNNVLYDGRRLWLVDWEAAFANDPHVDPATVANWYSLEGDAETALLKAAYGDDDPQTRARHFMMRQVVRLFIGVMMLMVTDARREPGAPSLSALPAIDPGEVREGLRSGRLRVDTDEGRILLASGNFAGVRAAVGGPAFRTQAARLGA